MSGTSGGEEANRESLEEPQRKELEKLLLRQKEIIDVFKSQRRKRKGKRRKLHNVKASNESIRELNRELREVNQRIARCKAYLGEPQKEPLKVTQKGAQRTKKRKKPTRSLHEGKPLPPPGTWIHIWRG